MAPSVEFYEEKASRDTFGMGYEHKKTAFCRVFSQHKKTAPKTNEQTKKGRKRRKGQTTTKKRSKQDIAQTESLSFFLLSFPAKKEKKEKWVGKANQSCQRIHLRLIAKRRRAERFRSEPPIP